MSKKNKNFDSDKHLRKQDEKGREKFNIAYNMLMASTGTSDVLKGKMSLRSKLLALGTTLALITTGAVAYNEVTKKSVAPNQPPTVIWNNTTTEVPVNVTTYIDRWNNNTVNNTIFNNITSPVYTKVPALISGPASLMKVLTKLNASERNQAFANLTSMYPELKLLNGTPVTDTPTALSSLLDCNGENDYLNGV
ncbi:MAG: hypothetical protein KKI14_01880, partial [Nanoarchaeota archaeon]|nr:hypothetical protein [Nanoarchaeota archaeon]